MRDHMNAQEAAGAGPLTANGKPRASRAAQFMPFAALTGSPVFTYINILRINNAKQLIATTDLPFSEIGYLVGVEDRYYFSKLFRKMTGMSPSDYYKEVRSE